MGKESSKAGLVSILQGGVLMEALLIIGALAAGAHYITKEDEKPVQFVYSSQPSSEIYVAPHKPIDFSKPGNFVVGDSPETGVQWVFETN